MACQTLNLRIPPSILCPPKQKHSSLCLPWPRKHLLLRNPSFVSLPSPPAARSKPLTLSIRYHPPPKPIILNKSRSSVFTSPFSSTSIPKTPYYHSSKNPTHDHDSVSTILTMAIPVSGWLPTSPAELAMIDSIQKRFVSRLGPLYLALAAAMGKWLSLYSEILMVRCWLSWFPNVPWERQPFSAFRDLCDPFLSLFSSIIPPIYGMDVSALLAFMVLGFLASLLNIPPATLN